MLPVDLEPPLMILTHYFHYAMWKHRYNGEWTRPPKPQLAWEDFEARVEHENLLTNLELFFLDVPIMLV